MLNESFFATLQLKGNTRIVRNSHLKGVDLPLVYVMPQVAPLEGRETLLSSKYVKKNQYQPISKLHFRNQIFQFPDAFEIFKAKVTDTWPGMMIRDFNTNSDELQLIVREQAFVAEISRFGSGVQVWLQMLWFLSRVTQNSIIALDEPDVYLHADLQRKLVSVLREFQGQTIIATHSVEIMAESKAREIVVVDKTKSKSVFADSDANLQKVIDEIGGVHNIQLSRLWGAKKCIFVEGKDMEILRCFVKTIKPNKYVHFTNLPNFRTDGWSGLKLACGFAKTFARDSNKDFKSFCILDRDNRYDSEIEDQISLADKSNLRLFVWAHKEIENYLLVPSAIQRVLVSKITDRKSYSNIDIPDIAELLDTLCESYRDELMKYYQTGWHDASPENRKLGIGHAYDYAKELIDRSWTTLESKLKIVHGKRILSDVNTHLTAMNLPVVSSLDIARCLKKNEIASEVQDVLTEILADC